ncbi:uncharacterized protein [Zea mays]|uniref:SFR19-like C-terminal domain-containing protein n=1 Tax=Zea mays TaxID=4577 RepID=A0A804LG30_MAIZE|nr:uncharacterized protein LOC100383458 isoform X2 [Zea mays]|eukprot:XP_008645057.1 uncharacterized protein LOC100383458 isoform X2 [Zea mays]
MYGQGGSFNPHYRHGPPPPQQQAGVTGSFPQQPVPPPRPPYPQHPGVRPPAGPYQHGVLPHQNQPYPFAQHGRMHQMPMLPPQQRGYGSMPMPGSLPPQQAMHQAPPQYPPLPPPPPRPPGFVHDNSCGAEAEAKEGASEGGRFAKTLEAATQLIVSDDSDMDMDGDEDSPSKQPLTPETSLPVTVECTGNVNVSKFSDVSTEDNAKTADATEDNAKTAHATEDGGSTFQLIQGYGSDDSANEADAGPGSANTLVTLPEDNLHGHLSDSNTEFDYQKHVNAKGNVNTPHGTEQNGKAENYHLKVESNPVKHGTDVLGHLAKEDTSGSEIEGGQSSKRHGRIQKKRTRSISPQGRSGSPVGANKSSPSQSSSPGKQSRPPFAKRLHSADDGNDSEGRVVQQEGLSLTSKLDSSSNDLIGKVGDAAAVGVALGQHCHSDNLISEHSQLMAAGATHKMQMPCPPSESLSDLNVSSSAGGPILTNQPAAGVPYVSVETTKSSMTSKHLQSHPQSLSPPEHMPSSNMIQLPGQPSFATSEFPQMQFHHKVVAPANEFLQNQMRSYPPQDVSHPRPFDFHHHTLPPAVPSNQQPSTIPVENAPVPHHNRWPEYSGGVGLSYSSHRPPYGQHQPPGNLDSGSNLVYPSFQRYPSNLPVSNNIGPLSDADLTKSSIKPHYNPFASTFDKTDPSLDIGPPVSPNAVGSVSTTAEHMNTLSPFGRSRAHAHGNSAEPVPNRQKLLHQEFASGAPYDPLVDSIEPSSSSINKVDLRKEKNWSAADRRDASKFMNLEVDSENMHGLGVVAESEVEGLGEVAADTETGVVENASPEFLGGKDWNSDIPVDFDNDQTLDKNKKGKDSRSMKLFKSAIADFVKEVLKPSWRQGNMSKEAFKTIVRKTVDKVSGSVPSSHIPKTPAKIKHYVQSSQRKVTKLVMGYVDKYVKP